MTSGVKQSIKLVTQPVKQSNVLVSRYLEQNYWAREWSEVAWPDLQARRMSMALPGSVLCGVTRSVSSRESICIILPVDVESASGDGLLFFLQHFLLLFRFGSRRRSAGMKIAREMTSFKSEKVRTVVWRVSRTSSPGCDWEDRQRRQLHRPDGHVNEILN